MARRARRRWEEVGAAVPGIGFRANGSLTVARDDAANAPSWRRSPASPTPPRGRSRSWSPTRRARATRPCGVRSPGALHCTEDAVVEPRRVLGALRAHLPATPGSAYRFHPGRRVVGVEPRALVDATGTRWEGDLVVVATGAAYDQLPGHRGRRGPGLRRVRLQMLETAPYDRDADDVAGRRRHPALLPGLRDGAAATRLPAQSARGGRAPPAAPPGAAARRRVDHRRHPRLRRAVRLRPVRGPERRAPGPGRRCSGPRSRRCGAAGRASTPSASTAPSACARRSSRACGWSRARAGAA